MSEKNIRRLESIAAELRGQANVADRPSQYAYLHELANSLERIAREEAS